MSEKDMIKSAKNGADVNMVSFKGTTPPQETRAHNAAAVAKVLRMNGATE